MLNSAKHFTAGIDPLRMKAHRPAPCETAQPGNTFRQVKQTVADLCMESSMPKAYWVATYRSVSDPDALAAYAKLSGPAIVAGGGRILVRGLPAMTYEAGLDQRTVVIEFDDIEHAKRVHDSPAYQEAMALLGNGAERDIRIVEGI